MNDIFKAKGLGLEPFETVDWAGYWRRTMMYSIFTPLDVGDVNRYTYFQGLRRWASRNISYG